nr:immunoglobulin light chain junction region [Mus musculus]
CLQYDNLLPTF